MLLELVRLSYVWYLDDIAQHIFKNLYGIWYLVKNLVTPLSFIYE